MLGVAAEGGAAGIAGIGDVYGGNAIPEGEPLAGAGVEAGGFAADYRANGEKGGVVEGGDGFGKPDRAVGEADGAGMGAAVADGPEIPGLSVADEVGKDEVAAVVGPDAAADAVGIAGPIEGEIARVMPVAGDFPNGFAECLRIANAEANPPAVRRPARGLGVRHRNADRLGRAERLDGQESRIDIGSRAPVRRHARTSVAG